MYDAVEATDLGHHGGHRSTDRGSIEHVDRPMGETFAEAVRRIDAKIDPHDVGTLLQ